MGIRKPSPCEQLSLCHRRFIMLGTHGRRNHHGRNVTALCPQDANRAGPSDGIDQESYAEDQTQAGAGTVVRRAQAVEGRIFNRPVQANEIARYLNSDLDVGESRAMLGGATV
jgi:hypothetical protein